MQLRSWPAFSCEVAHLGPSEKTPWSTYPHAYKPSGTSSAEAATRPPSEASSRATSFLRAPNEAETLIQGSYMQRRRKEWRYRDSGEMWAVRRIHDDDEQSPPTEDRHGSQGQHRRDCGRGRRQDARIENG